MSLGGPGPQITWFKAIFRRGGGGGHNVPPLSNRVNKTSINSTKYHKCKCCVLRHPSSIDEWAKINNGKLRPILISAHHIHLSQRPALHLCLQSSPPTHTPHASCYGSNWLIQYIYLKYFKERLRTHGRHGRGYNCRLQNIQYLDR